MALNTTQHTLPTCMSPLGAQNHQTTLYYTAFAFQTRGDGLEYMNYTSNNKYPKWGIIYTSSKVFTFDKFSEYFKISSPAGLNLLPIAFKKINSFKHFESAR